MKRSYIVPTETGRELLRLREIKRDRDRLRRWMRFLRRLPEVAITNIDGLLEHDRGREIPTAYLDAALRGEEPPRPPRRKR